MNWGERRNKVMSEFTPHYAPVMVLLFLGSAGLIGISLLVLLYAVIARSTKVAILGAGFIAMVGGGYAFLLFGSSLASHETVLPLGGWKYFCEIDCHIAYSIADVRSASAIGTQIPQVTAKGEFVIIRLKTWFDEHTISPHRGDSPLYTGDRLIALVDESGNVYPPSTHAETALAIVEGPIVSLSQPLRPGESFTTNLVFDVPRGPHKFRLLVADPADDWVASFIVGHETSFLHKKIYLSAPVPGHVPI
jgi:hypothetical protein